MSECIFCKIIAGEIPSSKVYEDDHVYAFLDLTQATPGHTLVIPKEHVQDIFAFPPETAGNLFSAVPGISKGLMRAFPEACGMNIVQNNGEVAYQSVFHSHLHLIPRYSSDDDFAITFADNSKDYTQEDLLEIATNIHQAIEVE